MSETAETFYVLLGDIAFPFAWVGREIEPTQLRIRKNSGTWSTLTGSGYTDILSEAKLYNEEQDEFGTNVYELEITDPLNGGSPVDVITTTIICSISAGRSKVAYEDRPCLPFADFSIAEDPSLITAISYKIAGDATVAKTSITRGIKYTGAHDGSNNSATLVSSNFDWTELFIDEDIDIVKNTTDGSEGVITGISSSAITATLAGGTENLWDTGDTFEIVDGNPLDLIAKRFSYTFANPGVYVVRLYVTDSDSNEVYADVTVMVQ